MKWRYIAICHTDGARSYLGVWNTEKEAWEACDRHECSSDWLPEYSVRRVKRD